MTTYLIGDIGGTNTRLQLYAWAGPRSTTASAATAATAVTAAADRLLVEHIYPSKQYRAFDEVVKLFLDKYTVGADAAPTSTATSRHVYPTACVLALAGPVLNRSCTLTNLGWTIEAKSFAKRFRLRHVDLINDFVAAGYGVLTLPAENLQPLHDPSLARSAPDAPKLIIGAGTGLGEAFAIPTSSDPNGPYRVFPTEGGHADFAPRTPREFAVMQSIQRQLSLDRVSIERLVSGTGLPFIYRALVELEPRKINPAVAKQVTVSKDPAAVITQNAQNKACELCVEAVQMFVSLYGAETGNFALKSLPFGGIYIAGGIATKIMWALNDDHRFMRAFLGKGRMVSLLKLIPIYVATGTEVGLRGAQDVARRSLQHVLHESHQQQEQTRSKL